MTKNLKNMPIIKWLSLKAIFLIINFSWIANILSLNKIKYWKQSF